MSLLARLRGPGRPIDERRWIVLDVETTGLNTRQDALLAIAAVALRFEVGAAPTLALADSFEAVLHHHSGNTDKANILLHGIGVGAQRVGAAPPDVLADFERWVGASPLVAYHAAFDRAMIGRAMAAACGRELANVWLDLAPVASALHRAVGADGLDDWLAHFAIPCLARHEAAADTLATAELLLRLWPAARAQGCDSFAGLRTLERQQRWLGGGG